MARGKLCLIGLDLRVQEIPKRRAAQDGADAHWPCNHRSRRSRDVSTRSAASTARGGSADGRHRNVDRRGSGNRNGVQSPGIVTTPESRWRSCPPPATTVPAIRQEMRCSSVPISWAPRDEAVSVQSVCGAACATHSYRRCPLFSARRPRSHGRGSRPLALHRDHPRRMGARDR